MKKKSQNLITWKIPYTCEIELFDIIQAYNNVLHFTYNRVLENPKITTKALTEMQHNINKANFIGSHLLNSAIYDAKAIVERNNNNKIIFGGKKLFLERCAKKISHEEFVQRRLSPLTSVGEACKKGNRLFQILDKDTILFKLTKDYHFYLNLQSLGKKRSKEIEKLIELQNNSMIPITYKLDLNYLYLSFDYNFLKTYNYHVKQNRVIAIDLNPNYVGYSVVDWLDEDKYHIINSGSFSIKPLNDYQKSLYVSSTSEESKYITNKRKYEVIHIAKQLFEICKHYHCEVFAIEDLRIQSSDKEHGRNYNKLCNNQWCRGLLVQQITKYVNSSSTLLQKVLPNYTSVLGNLVYRKEALPDEVLASIEISRRGFEFTSQYKYKRRPVKKNIVFPEIESVKNQIIQSLEELEFDVPEDSSIRNICSLVKKSKLKYRFSRDDVPSSRLFSKLYNKKYLVIYNFL